MFKSYYGLSCNPFDKQNLKERDCFLSHDHKEMASRLDYLKEIRGIGVFTARPGMGKSYALRCFAASLSTNLYQMEYFCLSTISVTEFYRQICTCLGVDTGGGKTAMGWLSKYTTDSHPIYFTANLPPVTPAFPAPQRL